MHDVEQRRNFLNLVHNHDLRFGMARHQLAKALGAGRISALEFGREKIHHERVGIDHPQPRGLPGSARTEQEVVPVVILKKSPDRRHLYLGFGEIDARTKVTPGSLSCPALGPQTVELTHRQ